MVRLGIGGEGGTLIVAIDANNLRELQAGRDMCIPLEGMPRYANVFLVYRATLDEAMLYVSEQTGIPVPPITPAPPPPGGSVH